MFDINKKIKIGNLKLDFPFFLAPMAGVTDYAFRVIAKEFGAGVVYSEFVSAHGIIRKNEKTLNMIKFSEFERPIGIQIFGDTPEVMESAARLVYEKFKPDLIDINYGCPVPKVTKKGAGSAALKDLCLMEDITEAVVKAVDIPVTVKMRAGWNSENIVSTKAGINLEKIGIKAITLHPRTTVQMYKGHANWDLIKELKDSVNIPVIGNGDIKSIEDINKMFTQTNCDGIMIGRAALGNPWFFTQIKKYINNEDFNEISLEERLQICQKHLELLVQIHGEVVGSNNMKKHFAWYFKGFKGASFLRKKFVLAKNYSEMKDFLYNIRH
ncbi:MAG: tRNA dihydrouridine synthase DusB [Candidatus Marinimicrobia bacterium]|jgi:tRNA-dihydrouridine synthase B|nr:tRNA dihydrouridine synthase DusB [Candidatus Neomarinimicrobiota bacterium]